MKLLYFDLETTGTDTERDRIVEISIFDHMGHAVVNDVVNPGIPIPRGATEVHGISDDDVKGKPHFSEIAPFVEEMCRGAILVGYNNRSFDTPLLHNELRRAGGQGLKTDESGSIIHPEIDLFAVWQNLEPRTLVGAARRFAGVDLADDAHRADADARVLRGVLEGMGKAFRHVTLGTQELMELSVPEWAVDRGGKFRREEDGTVVFNFGKHRGNPVGRHRDYLRWMLSADFGGDTKAWIERLLNGEG